MKRLFHLIGLILVSVATIYFLSAALKHAAVLSDLRWNLKSYVSFCTAISLSAITVFSGGYAWYLLLQASAQPSNLGKVLAIFSIAQFAKYIPGNIAQHIGRVTLARTYGFRVPVVIFTIILETAWVIVAASTFATVSFFLIDRKFFRYSLTIPTLWQLVLAIVVAVAIPLVGYWAINHFKTGTIRKFFGVDKFVIPNLSIMSLCFLLYTFNLLVMGMSIYILAREFFGVGESHFWFVTSVFALAWIAGFLTPGSPAGIGVREAVLVATMSPIYGAGVAAWLALSLRAVTTLADGLTFVVAIIAKRSFYPVS